MAPPRERERARSVFPIAVLVVLFFFGQQIYIARNKKSCSSEPEFKNLEDERNQYKDEVQKLSDESSNLADEVNKLKKLVENLRSSASKQIEIANLNGEKIKSIDIEKTRLAAKLSEVQSQKSQLETDLSKVKENATKLTHLLKSAEEEGSKCKDGSKYIFTRFRDRPEVQMMFEKNIARNGEMPDKWRHRLIPAENPSLWQQRAFKPHGIYGFVQLSGYRSSSSEFSAPGLVAKLYPKEKRLLEGCRWVGEDGVVIQGSLSLHLGSESFDQQYEAGVLSCQLEKETSASGGHVIARLDEEEFVMYREDPLEVQEWLEFHRVLHNVSFFQLYNAGGVGEDLDRILDPYREKGLLDVTDMREVLLFSVVSWGQKLVVADCMHRNRYLSKWVFMGDLDEYLITRPPNTVRSLLEKYHFKDFLAYGAFNWDVSRCVSESPGTDQYTVERILYRHTQMHCVDLKRFKPELCYSGFGHRKYLLNPRKVYIANVHDPLPYDLEGHFFVGTEEMWHNHYRGLSSTFYLPNICSKALKPLPDDNFHIVKDIAKLVSLVRSCPLQDHPECLRKVGKKLRIRWKKKGLIETN